jgi:hypothetical protein
MFEKEKKTDIDSSKGELENLYDKNKKKELKTELVFKPSTENEVLLFEALHILLPKELIKNYLISKNRDSKT